MPAPTSNRVLLGLVVACACVSSAQSLVPETTRPSSKSSPTSKSLDRRDLIRALSSAVLSGSILLNSQTNQPAWALKPNNEALCGTGFFTNIAQYKCTDIGDISDEGQSRKTTAEEESRLDGLMSKFGDLDLPSSSSSGADEQSESSRDDLASAKKE